MNRMPFAPTDGCCRRCGRDAVGLDGEFLCTGCRETRPHFDRVASAVFFEAEARDLVNAFKFHYDAWLRDDFVDWMEGVLRARFRVEEIDIVVPVPSTVAHRWDRGYSPCVELARPLARRIGRPFGRFVMCRRGRPARQRGLDEAARRENVVDTFAELRPSAVRGRTVLVVDDIMTTGATLSECAAELKRAGASRVWCVTLARTAKT